MFYWSLLHGCLSPGGSWELRARVNCKSGCLKRFFFFKSANQQLSSKRITIRTVTSDSRESCCRCKSEEELRVLFSEAKEGVIIIAISKPLFFILQLIIPLTRLLRSPGHISSLSLSLSWRFVGASKSLGGGRNKVKAISEGGTNTWLIVMSANWDSHQKPRKECTLTDRTGAQFSR